MKHILILSTFVLFGSVKFPLFAQQDNFIIDYLECWENSRKYLIHGAGAMPEDKCGYKIDKLKTKYNPEASGRLSVNPKM